MDKLSGLEQKDGGLYYIYVREEGERTDWLSNLHDDFSETLFLYMAYNSGKNE